MNSQIAALIFLVALAIRLVYVAAIFDGGNSLRVHESALYEQAAAGIVETGRLSVLSADGTPRPFVDRGPGYPGWLALFRLLADESPLYPVLAQAVLDAVACLLVAWLASFFNPRLAVIAGGLAAINLNMVVHAAQISSASLLLALMLGAMVYAWRYYRRPTLPFAAIAGLCFAAAWLTDPIVAPLFVILIAVLAVSAWYRGLDVAGAAAHVGTVVAAAMIFVGPIMFENYRTFGHAQLSAEFGPRLFYRTAPATLEFGVGLPRVEAVALLRERLKAHRASRETPPPSGNPFAVSAELGQVATAVILDTGVAAVGKAWATGAAVNLVAPTILATRPLQTTHRPRFFATPGVNPVHKIWNFFVASGSLAILIVSATVFTVLCRVMAAAALLQMPGRLPVVPTVLLSTVSAYALVASGPVVGLGERLLLEPLLAILLAAAALWIADHWWQPIGVPAAGGTGQSRATPGRAGVRRPS